MDRYIMNNKSLLKVKKIKEQLGFIPFYCGCLLSVFLLFAIFLMCLSAVSSIFYIDMPLIERSFFPVISILGNLIVWEFIFVSVKLAKIKFEKRDLYLMLGVWCMMAVYYLCTIVGRKFIYYWDFGNYLSMQYTLENIFADNLFNGLRRLVLSFSSDYTMFINIFLEFPFCFTNRSGNAFVLVQLVNVFLPLMIVTGTLLKKVSTNLDSKKQFICFCLGILFITTAPLLHISAIKGQPDWFGLIFCELIVILTLDYKFEKNNPLQNVLIFILTISLILTRRWYLYFVVSWYMGYGCSVLLDIIKKAKKDCVSAKLQLKNFFVFAIASVIVAGVFFAKMIAHILFYNYSERYAAYSQGGLFQEFSNQFYLLGTFLVILILIGIIIGLIKSVYREFVVRSLLGWLIAIGLFTNVQNMGKHQSLMLMPYYVLFLFIGIICLTSIVKHAFLMKIYLGVMSVCLLANIVVNYSEYGIRILGTAQCNVIAADRDDYNQIRELAEWIDSQCTQEETAYIIPHGNKYNPDLFRNILFPNTSVWSKVSYGAAVSGTHAFPIEIFTAKYVITCNPFPKDLEYTVLAERYNTLFYEISVDKFELVQTFDMGNDTKFFVYQRKESADYNEVECYRQEMNDENEKFPDLFDAVLDGFIQKNGLELSVE